jgi:hypothetical protein
MADWALGEAILAAGRRRDWERERGVGSGWMIGRKERLLAVVASVVLVEIRATFEEERGYGPVDNSPPCHVLFLSSIFSLFNLLFLE